MKKISDIVESYRDEITRHTSELIRIPSVESPERPGMPFGENVDKALRYVLELAEELGLKTVYFDGYAGHVDVGEGDDLVGVLVHVDVVPEGRGWELPAFGGEVHDNRVYGRGAVDDKGPVIASLFALKALQDLGTPLKKRVRLIVGTHEECPSGWTDLHRYFENYPRPEQGFSPDAAFPVIYGEKGLLNFSLQYMVAPDLEPVQVISLAGGEAPNMVPDYCEAELSVEESGAVDLLANHRAYVEQTGCPVTLEQRAVGRYIVSANGVSAHASTPEEGVSAISRVIDFLAQCPGLNASIAAFAASYAEKIGFDVNGEGLGCAFEDEASGRLTCNVGQVSIKDGNVILTVNLRYPVSSAGETVTAGIKNALAGTGMKFHLIDDSEPLFVPTDDELVVKLMDAYARETGDTTTGPLTIGGGTYARALPKGVAFGPRLPGRPNLAHQKDEYIEIEDLIIATRIYASALLALAE